MNFLFQGKTQNSSNISTLSNVLSYLTIKGCNRDTRCQNLHLHRSDSSVPISPLLFQFLSVFSGSLLSHILPVPSQALTTTQQFVCSVQLRVFVADCDDLKSCHLIQRHFIPSMVHSFRLMASEMLASPLSAVITSRCGIFPWRYVTFIREQGPVLLRLTTYPLPGSSLASHTLNGHFLDTWAIRLFTNITNT